MQETEFFFSPCPLRPLPAAQGPAVPGAVEGEERECGRAQSHWSEIPGWCKQLSSLPQKDRTRFDVLLTSYEIVNGDASVLRKFEWATLIVDEGHRLKNKESKLFQTLKTYATTHRILLTGTPLQVPVSEPHTLAHISALHPGP